MRGEGMHDLDVLQWVQQLYEGGVLPVREIARLAGVTERMIYKYVQTGGWCRRRGSVTTEASPTVTHRAAKACVAAARKARRASEKAMTEAQADAALIKAKREREVRYKMLDALNGALLEMAAWIAETHNDAKARARAEPYQHRVLDALGQMQWSFSSLPGLSRQSRSGTQ